jgi:hypothetical protein
MVFIWRRRTVIIMWYDGDDITVTSQGSEKLFWQLLSYVSLWVEITREYLLYAPISLSKRRRYDRKTNTYLNTTCKCDRLCCGNAYFQHLRTHPPTLKYHPTLFTNTSHNAHLMLMDNRVCRISYELWVVVVCGLSPSDLFTGVRVIR